MVSRRDGFGLYPPSNMAREKTGIFYENLLLVLYRQTLIFHYYDRILAFLYTTPIITFGSSSFNP